MFNRHEFYQKPDEVVVTIFAKGVAPEDVLVEFGEQVVCFHLSKNFFYWI